MKIIEFTEEEVAFFVQSPIGMGVEFMQQWQHLQNLLCTVSPQKQERSNAVMFDKKILDFDYGDEDDENTSPHAANASNEQPLNKFVLNQSHTALNYFTFSACFKIRMCCGRYRI